MNEDKNSLKTYSLISLKNIIKSTDFPAIQTLATYIVLCVRHDSWQNWAVQGYTDTETNLVTNSVLEHEFGLSGTFTKCFVQEMHQSLVMTCQSFSVLAVLPTADLETAAVYFVSWQHVVTVGEEAPEISHCTVRWCSKLQHGKWMNLSMCWCEKPTSFKTQKVTKADNFKN